jgi:KipI family sensor histidine kinase inhibitor
MKVMPYGDAALLLQPDDAGAVLTLAAVARSLHDVDEVVPAARTVLVRAAPDVLAGLSQRLTDLGAGAAAGANDAYTADEVVLDVRYDGADLADTAGELGCAVDDLVRRHSAGDYVVAFCGFVPGFAYLRGLDESLHVGRRTEPRARVPAGSVGIAGEFTGVYPRQSPGGWRLLGRTDAPLWDLGRSPPALLTPGTRVRFRPT